MIQTLMLDYVFGKDSRSSLTFSDTSKITLSKDKDGRYGIALKAPYSDATAKTSVKKPMSILKLKGFQEDSVKPANTAIKHRMLFGPSAATPMFWNGSAWVAAGSNDWNTAQELQDHLSSLQLPSKYFSVISKLESTDGKETPILKEVKFVGEFQIEWWDDLIYDTIIREMKASLRATTDVKFSVVSTTSTIDLAGTYKLENEGYNFTGVVSAFNLTADPNKLKNIAASYAPGATGVDGDLLPGVVTLSESVATDDVVLLTLQYVPEIAVNTNQDYYETAKLPQISFENIFEFNPLNGTFQGDSKVKSGNHVKDFVAGTAVEFPKPRQVAVRFDYVVMANLQMDEARLHSALDRWAASHRQMRTYGMDLGFRLQQQKSFDTQLPPAGLDDVRNSNGSFTLYGVTFYLGTETVVPLVKNVNVNTVFQSEDIT